MALYTTESAKTIPNFIKLIEKIKRNNEQSDNKADLLFRGQPIDKPLLPKIARLHLKGKSMRNTEKIMLEEFERGIIPLTEFKPDNIWDLIALAQHHGLPTRLLDWTYSALVALWFAVEKPPQIDEEGNKLNGVVWILAANTNDFRTNTKKINPLSNKITKIFRSSVISRRISAQSGVFTIHKINQEDKIIKLETHATFGSKLTKVIIPESKFADLRKELHILGVNNATIYPDIDGYCRHLEWRYTKYIDELSSNSISVNSP